MKTKTLITMFILAAALSSCAPTACISSGAAVSVSSFYADKAAKLTPDGEYLLIQKAVQASRYDLMERELIPEFSPKKN